MLADITRNGFFYLGLTFISISFYGTFTGYYVLACTCSCIVVNVTGIIIYIPIGCTDKQTHAYAGASNISAE